MKIEYVLTESNQKSPNKTRIKDLVRRACKSLNTDTIIVQPNRNEFELEYSIKSQKTNSENNNDIIYHFVVTSDHPKKERQAINLEYFNTKFKGIIDTEKNYHFKMSEKSKKEINEDIEENLNRTNNKTQEFNIDDILKKILESRK